MTVGAVAFLGGLLATLFVSCVFVILRAPPNLDRYFEVRAISLAAMVIRLEGIAEADPHGPVARALAAMDQRTRTDGVAQAVRLFPQHSRLLTRLLK